MTLLDIVVPLIPSLEEIVSALGYAGVRINVHLTPDRFSWAPQEQTSVVMGIWFAASSHLRGEPSCYPTWEFSPLVS
jgi:hypothetical protein